MSLRLPAPRSTTYDPAEDRAVRAEIEKAFLRMSEEIRDVRVKPTVRDVFVSFDASGRAYVRIRCNEDTLSIRFAVANDAAPTIATVRAADPSSGNEFDLTLEGPFPVGTLMYCSVIPYSGPGGDGREGRRFTQSGTFGQTEGNACRAVVIDSDAATITVQVNADSGIGSGTVALVSATGTTLLSGNAVGVEGASPQVYVFARPAATAGDGEVRFTGSFPDAVNDDDIILIPEQDKVLTFLASRATILQLAETEAFVRVVIADPFPQAADLIQLSYVTTNIPGITPVSPQTVSPAAVFSSLAGTFVDFVVDRPAAGDGEVLFTTESLGAARIADIDVVTIPPRAVVPASLDISYTVTDSAYTISWDGAEVVELSIAGAAFATPPASPIVVSRQAYSGGKNRPYTFRAIGSLGDIQTQTVLVLKQDAPPAADTRAVTSVTLANGFTPGDGGGSVDVSWLAANTTGSETYNVEWEVVAGDPISSGAGEEVGVTSGVTIAMALGNNAEVRVKVKMYSSGSLIAEKEITSLVPV